MNVTGMWLGVSIKIPLLVLIISYVRSCTLVIKTADIYFIHNIFENHVDNILQ